MLPEHTNTQYIYIYLPNIYVPEKNVNNIQEKKLSLSSGCLCWSILRALGLKRGVYAHHDAQGYKT